MRTDAIDLRGIQANLEYQTLHEARQRLEKELDKQAKRNESGVTVTGEYYIRNYTGIIAPIIEQLIAPVKKRGKELLAIRMLRDTGIEPAVIARLTMKAVVNLFSLMRNSDVSRTKLCRHIGELVHDEWRVRTFADDAHRKKLLVKLEADFNKRGYPRHRRVRTIRNYFDAERLTWSQWSTKDKISLGYVLMSIMNKELNILVPLDAKNMRYTMADEWMTDVKRMATRHVHMFVLHKPMVIPPVPWGEANLFKGGYHTHNLRPFGIIKGIRKRDVQRVMDMDLTQVFPAINALQETAWRINREMVEALDWSYNVLTTYEGFNRQGIGKLPTCNPIPLPELPERYKLDEHITKEHNHKAYLVHDRNRRDKSRRLSAIIALSIAKQFVDFERLYFPHNMDSRGRIYPIPGILNPQGPDYVKSLLEFSEGKPIENQCAADWLAIAGANAYGKDKISLQDRVKWVHDNEEMILSISRDWRGDIRWTDAGDPFCFLRFCLEWRDYRKQGFGFVSHMPVPVDATCSGLQHYAAMMKDEVGGMAVNLVPGLTRQDIYADVAQVVTEALARDATGSTEMLTYKRKGKEGDDDVEFEVPVSTVAKNWLDFGLTRDMVKRQVMVVPYAGTFLSCKDYTEEKFNERLEAGETAVWDVEDYDLNRVHLLYLSQHIWRGIAKVVLKGREAMKWLTSLARKYSIWANGQEKENAYDRRLTWVTPDGFEVSHYEPEEEQERFKCFFDGRVDISTYDEASTLNDQKMSSSFPPNFVHSLDATHLRLAVLAGVQTGITSFCMIHDSFGVHASNMQPFLDECIKPTFIRLYAENDMLGGLFSRFSDVLDIVPPPATGKLDLQAIQRSEFFFS